MKAMRWLNGLIVLCLAITLFGEAKVASAATVWFVNGSALGANTGDSWANAFSDLQMALNVAKPGDQVWVAAGTYRPSVQTSADPRSATFQLIHNVDFYGGFAGYETDLTQRNLRINETILSGDIGVPGSSQDNAYHVVSVGIVKALLDGFIITGGNADVLGGGGMLVQEDEFIQISNVVFTGNQSAGPGAGLAAIGGAFRMTNVVFHDNHSAADGGGLYATGCQQRRSWIYNAWFLENTSGGSGGGAHVASCKVFMRELAFENNRAQAGGGAALGQLKGRVVLQRLLFRGNQAETRGGALLNDGKLSIANSLLAGNQAGQQGGAIWNGASGRLHLTNVTLSSNPGGSNNHAVHSEGPAFFRNAIIWDASDQPAPVLTGLISVGYSLVQGWGSGASMLTSPMQVLKPAQITTYDLEDQLEGAEIPTEYAGEGWAELLQTDSAFVLTDDPLFVDPLGMDGQPGTGDEDYTLQNGSPAIDVGNNHFVRNATLDLAGNRRIINEIVDLGAYEKTRPIYVDDTAIGANNGSSWQDAFVSLQSGLEAAGPGDQIWVAEGIYKPSRLASDHPRSATFALVEGVKTYGGFAGTEVSLLQRNWLKYPSVLTGDIGEPEEVNDNAYHVVTAHDLSLDTLLSGFVISGGNANSAEPGPNRAGGGMLVSGGSPTLVNLDFRGNSAHEGGGLANFAAAENILLNIRFLNNTALNGGGLSNTAGSTKLINLTFEGNTASQGGGLYQHGAQAAVLTNAVFDRNLANIAGGAIYHDSSGSLKLLNATLSGNQADSGGAIFQQAGALSLVNSIVWGNPTRLDQPIRWVSGSLTADYSDIEGLAGIAGGHNLDANPRFIDPDSGNLFLSTHSPAIDQGDNEAIAGILFDASFRTRVRDGRVDMGAFESWSNIIWPWAAPLLDQTGGQAIQIMDAQATIQQSLEQEWQSRWYTVPVEPGDRLIITLTDLAADYNLVLYRDIEAAYLEGLNSPPNSEEALALQSAKVAPDRFLPDNFTPSRFTTDVFAGDTFAPDRFLPDRFLPDRFLPDRFLPDRFLPDRFLPDRFLPDRFLPDRFLPDRFLPDRFLPDRFLQDFFTPDTFLPDRFLPDRFLDLYDAVTSSAQMESLLAVSLNPNIDDEKIVQNAWNDRGHYYIQVRGRNGAYVPDQPFTLKVVRLPSSCNQLASHDTTTSLPVDGPGYRSIFLVDWQKLEAGLPYSRTPGQAEKLAILKGSLAQPNSLASFAQLVDGVVVDVSQDATIQALKTQADENRSCPYATNLVATAIKDLVDRYRAANPGLESVVLVGSDDVIPFFRHADTAEIGTEDMYFVPVEDDTTSQASLRNNFVLSQDDYGSTYGLMIGNDLLPIPDLAVGRLVEQPGEILNMLAAYRAQDGRLRAPGAALVTGYDFVTDAAEAVRAELEAGIDLPGLVDSDLIHVAGETEPWSAKDLKDKLLGQSYDILYMAGHFSAGSAVAADEESRLWSSENVYSINSDNLSKLSNTQLYNSLVYSIGCHSGYNIVDAHGLKIAGTLVSPEADWAQFFAQKGATWIGGTGYQYGNTDLLIYSERLYLNFTRQMRVAGGSNQIGDLLGAAKQQYLSEVAPNQITGIHKKVLLESVLYGLPMMKLDMPNQTCTPEPEANVSSTPVTSGPGAELGLSTYALEYLPNLRLNEINGATYLSEAAVDACAPGAASRLNSMSTAALQTGAGDFESISTKPGLPVLPLKRINVTSTNPAQTPRGVVFLEGRYFDRIQTRPYLADASFDFTNLSPETFSSETFYPTRLWAINYYDTLSGYQAAQQKLTITPSQYRSYGLGTEKGVRREYGQMNFRVYYSQLHPNNTRVDLSGPPSVELIRAFLSDNVIYFTVRSYGSPSAAIQEVLLNYTFGPDAEGYGVWNYMNLAPDPLDATLWRGILPVGPGQNPDDLHFMVQSVNAAGMVTIMSGFNTYYNIERDTSRPPSYRDALDTQLTLAGPLSGHYGEEVTFQAELKAGQQPVANNLLTLEIGKAKAYAYTGQDGKAELRLKLVDPFGSYSAEVVSSSSTQYKQARASITPFDILKQPTTLTIQPPVAANGYRAVIILLGQFGQPLVGEIVLVTLTDTSGTRYVPLMTNSKGAASLPINPQPGPFDLLASFGEAPFENRFYDPSHFTLNDVIIDPYKVNLTYTGDTYIVLGANLHLEAQLTAISLPAPDLSDGLVRFELRDMNGVLVTSQTVPVSADGKAYRDLSSLAIGLKGGLYEITSQVVGGILTSDPVKTMLVVHDPNVGTASPAITGGGWFISPSGASTLNPSQTGKAFFTFNVKSARKSLSGNIQFKFGDLLFRITSLSKASVVGTRAQISGVGTINGKGTYHILLTVTDERTATGKQADKIRVKITDSKGKVVYDNQWGALDSAPLTTLVDGGQVVIHK